MDGYLWLGVSPGLWVRIAGEPPRVNRQPCIFYSIVYFMVYFMLCAPELCQPLTCGAPFRGRASAADEREASARERRCAVILKNALALFFLGNGGGSHQRGRRLGSERPCAVDGGSAAAGHRSVARPVSRRACAQRWRLFVCVRVFVCLPVSCVGLRWARIYTVWVHRCIGVLRAESAASLRDRARAMVKG